MLNIVVQNQNSTKNKFVLLAAGAVLLAASVTTFVCTNKSNDSMDDLFRANVEALARSESAGSGEMCSQIDDTTDGTHRMRRCSDCDAPPRLYPMIRVAFCY